MARVARRQSSLRASLHWLSAGDAWRGLPCLWAEVSQAEQSPSSASPARHTPPVRAWRNGNAPPSLRAIHTVCTPAPEPHGRARKP